MKKSDGKEEQRAVERFRTLLAHDSGSIQVVIPLTELAELLRNGVDHVLFHMELKLIQSVMEYEAGVLSGKRYDRHDGQGMERWGTAPGSVMINGQKVSIQRPRVRNGDRDVKLGSYELFRREDETQRHLWSQVMSGLSIRGSKSILRAHEGGFGVSRSAMSERFVRASRKQAQELVKRDLSTLNICVLMIDGTDCYGEQLITALGIDQTGTKTILGFQRGTAVNQEDCDRLLEGILDRGLRRDQPLLIVTGPGRGLRASVKKHWASRVPVQLCQLQKRQEILAHLPLIHRNQWENKLAKAYELSAHREARRALNQLHRDLMEVNPKAARSLEDGLDETLTLHRIGAPAELRGVLQNTNLMQSTFSTVRNICQHVKRWHHPDQRKRWIGSALMFAEANFRRIVGHHSLPKLVASLQTQSADKKAAQAA